VQHITLKGGDLCNKYVKVVFCATKTTKGTLCFLIKGHVHQLMERLELLLLYLKKFYIVFWKREETNSCVPRDCPLLLSFGTRKAETAPRESELPH
jgi:hypothetical protein